MNPNCPTEPPPRQKIPKDGLGPRGVPDCYYTSRVLNSTFHYARFVKRLRQEEEDTRRGEANARKEALDAQTLNFFIRCDRRALINRVGHRVELCLQAYEQDVKEKKTRLIDLLEAEEQVNITAFAVQTQEGKKAAWRDQQERLQYLLDKRRQEHEARFKEADLSKCAHVLPCINKIREKEAQKILLYQMKEKQMRKMADVELDKMWHQLAMKESDMLAARMEVDEMERLRRELESKQYSERQVEARRRQREHERELLKQEALRMKEIWKRDDLKEAEAERQRAAKRREQGMERKNTIQERKDTVARLEQDAKVVQDTWASLAGQGRAAELAKEELRKQKERDLDVCNARMSYIKNRFAAEKFDNDPLVLGEGQRRQDATDLQRCRHRKWIRDSNMETRAIRMQQIQDKKTQEDAEKKNKGGEEYERQLQAQLKQLVDHKQLTDAQARKLHQTDLREQMEYNRLLKERAKEEAELELKKCKIAAEEYKQEVAKMLQRPFFSESVHPFMRQMASGLKMAPTCPCTLPSYCLRDPQQVAK